MASFTGKSIHAGLRVLGSFFAALIGTLCTSLVALGWIEPRAADPPVKPASRCAFAAPLQVQNQGRVARVTVEKRMRSGTTATGAREGDCTTYRSGR